MIRWHQIYKQWAWSKSLLNLTAYLNGSMDNRGNADEGFCKDQGSQDILYG